MTCVVGEVFFCLITIASEIDNLSDVETVEMCCCVHAFMSDHLVIHITLCEAHNTEIVSVGDIGPSAFSFNITLSDQSGMEACPGLGEVTSSVGSGSCSVSLEVWVNDNTKVSPRTAPELVIFSGYV
jgi:hypothetical protein